MSSESECCMMYLVAMSRDSLVHVFRVNVHSKLIGYWSFNEDTPLMNVIDEKEATGHGNVEFPEGISKPLITCHPCL